MKQLRAPIDRLPPDLEFFLCHFLPFGTMIEVRRLSRRWMRCVMDGRAWDGALASRLIREDTAFTIWQHPGIVYRYQSSSQVVTVLAVQLQHFMFAAFCALSCA